MAWETFNSREEIQRWEDSLFNFLGNGEEEYGNDPEEEPTTKGDILDNAMNEFRKAFELAGLHFPEYGEHAKKLRDRQRIDWANKPEAELTERQKDYLKNKEKYRAAARERYYKNKLKKAR